MARISELYQKGQYYESVAYGLKRAYDIDDEEVKKLTKEEIDKLMQGLQT